LVKALFAAIAEIGMAMNTFDPFNGVLENYEAAEAIVVFLSGGRSLSAAVLLE
jgi:hypothetical protein